MDKIWLYITAVIVFALLAAISYKLMKTYVKKTFGENWLKSWVNRAYFGQCLIFISGGGTLLVLFLLK